VVPAPLVAVLAGILAVRIFGLDKHGLDIVGHITGGLPSFGLPHVPAADYVKLAGSAVGVMLVGFAEGRPAPRRSRAADAAAAPAARPGAPRGDCPASRCPPQPSGVIEYLTA
jgi:sulfate permease, SulP family